MSDAGEKTTPLYQEHVRLGAKIIPFGGWLMPVQYTSIMDEHQAVRKSVGMFDISHMGQLLADGSEARTWLNRMLTNNIEKLEIGTGQYTFLLNEAGGIIDDLIVYRVAEQKFLLVVNASRSDEDFAWLEQHLSQNVALTNRSADFGGVAIQGPRVVELFHALLGAHTELPPRNHLIDTEVGGMPVFIHSTWDEPRRSRSMLEVATPVALTATRLADARDGSSSSKACLPCTARRMRSWNRRP